MFNPKFTYTDTMVSTLLSIEYSRAVVNLAPLPDHVERDLIEQTKVKMTHYSTRIAGNGLDHRTGVTSRQTKARDIPNC